MVGQKGLNQKHRIRAQRWLSSAGCPSATRVQARDFFEGHTQVRPLDWVWENRIGEDLTQSPHPDQQKYSQENENPERMKDRWILTHPA